MKDLVVLYANICYKYVTHYVILTDKIYNENLYARKSKERK